MARARARRYDAEEFGGGQDAEAAEHRFVGDESLFAVRGRATLCRLLPAE